MDRTLKKATRKNKRRIERNTGAWERFSPDASKDLPVLRTRRLEAPAAARDSPTSTGPRRMRSGGTPTRNSTATLCRTAARCWCGG